MSKNIRRSDPPEKTLSSTVCFKKMSTPNDWLATLSTGQLEEFLRMSRERDAEKARREAEEAERWAKEEEERRKREEEEARKPPLQP